MALENKVALVTGSGRGIGKAIALRLAHGGADLVINDIGINQPLAEEAAEQIRALGRRAVMIMADVADSAAANAMVEQVLSEYGRIDILVNNAGITRDQLLLRMTDQEWRSVMEINLNGSFNCLRAVARPMLKQRGGCIISIASVIGLIGNAGQANYAASKAGIIGLTKSAAKELAARGVRVNAIAPGFIMTAMTDALGEEARANLLRQIPLQRLGTAEDVAEAVAFLASESASYITGQVLQVDGGMVM